MSDEQKETLLRVQNGLYHLQRGLYPFVEQHMTNRHGTKWLHYASRAAGSGPNDGLDAYGLVKTMLDNWREVFDEAFPFREKHNARRYASAALMARNAVSHNVGSLPDSDALSYLDQILRLLKVTQAPSEDVEAVQKLYDEQRRSGIVPETTPAQASASAPVPANEEIAFPAPAEGKRLTPWVDVALPHPDVLANRFRQSEFAADLGAVDAGDAAEISEDYATPLGFFRITFMTEGLRRVLFSVMQRLAGQGGDPVIGLQTSFGGGKTHTMLAIYHLARALAEGHKPEDLAGIGEIAEPLRGVVWPKPARAVFVGSSKGPDVPLTRGKEPVIRTLWGYLAWRLAGEAGLALMREAEAAWTNPGADLLVDLFRLSGPSVILIDELTMFARQLPDGRFEALLSFIQSLTEAAARTRDIVVVGSLPESRAEAGGEKGAAALLRLEKVFGRVQSAWLPASGDETYEIVRRRLFQPLDSEGEKVRDATVAAFARMYRENKAEFPPEVHEARYAELLKLAYPIHPELFGRLSRNWATLEKFQRTRGVLQFMAGVIGVLWKERTPDPLITPARVPVGHERVRVSVLYPLDPAFGAVVDAEVDGEGSLSSRMEANPQRRITQARAATRVARSIFLCSAPTVGLPNAGVSGPSIRLACAEPGDQLAVFGEALRELSERATYLYDEAGRYWFATQPTLNRLADDRARTLPAYEVDDWIISRLREDTKRKEHFARVYTAPDEPSAIEETRDLSLVVLGPAYGHLGRGITESAAVVAVQDALLRCRTTQRRFRNALIFVAPDEGELAKARDVAARAMAWQSIVEDKVVTAQLTGAQREDAASKSKQHRDAAERAIRTGWSHIFYPIPSDVAGQPFKLEQQVLANRGDKPVAVAVYDRLKPGGEGIIKEKLGAENFRMVLQDIWPEDRSWLPVAEIADWFATFVYLPKLRDGVVLEQAIAESVSRMGADFGFADHWDDEKTRFANLVFERTLTVPARDGVLVRAEEARQQNDAELPPPSSLPAPNSDGKPPSVSGTESAQPSPERTRPTRFYGSVTLDTLRTVKNVEMILTSVVAELQRAPGVRVTLTLDIEAESDDGFNAEDVSVVRDNATQLKFKSTGFE